MKTIGLWKAIRLCRQYRKMDEGSRNQLRSERLKNLLTYAREHSPYYARLYADLPEGAGLAELPPVTKPELMDNWNEWLTDYNVKLMDVKRFMSNRDNLGKKLQGKYQVYTTSGSTGNPLVMLCDKNTSNITNAISFCRAYARSEDMKAFIAKGGRSIGVYADSGFYLGNGSIHAKLRAFPWKKRQIGIVDALLPVDKIVNRLNEFDPVMLGGYPSSLELLIKEQLSGRLHISPSIIMTGGEYLSDDLRQRLSDTFGCYVQTSYACTEGGTIACECREKHLHINDDWLIIEAVDKYGKPVPDGELADRMLLTNLANYTQPLIRYEVTDRIILHHDSCPCGNPSPWLEVEGRTDDVTTFVQNGRLIQIAPLAIYAALKEVHSLARFQLEVWDNNETILHLMPVEGMDKKEVFCSAREALSRFLASQGITDFSCTLSEELPAASTTTGKFKHIINKQTVV